MATVRATTTSACTPTVAPRWNGSWRCPVPLEQQEKLEQLRALEAGMRIDITIVDSGPARRRHPRRPRNRPSDTGKS
jgi:hypothetical protein